MGDHATRARIRVDGDVLDVPASGTLASALRDAGVVVPTLCSDPRLSPHPVCRMCVVEVDGEPRPVPACATSVRDGMVVRTKSEALEAQRRLTLAMLARRHPSTAMDGAPSEFTALVRHYGLEGELGADASPVAVDASHPYLRVDMARCIDCQRCVRICDEVQGQFVWHVWHRGDERRIVPDSGADLRSSSCVACGACVTACPTGALEDVFARTRGQPTARTRTVCPYCGVGCELSVGVRDGRIVEVRPVMDAPVNRGHLCVKGRYAFEFVDAPDRLSSPLLRRKGKLEPVGWDEAIATAAARLGDALDRHGPGAVAMLGSARATNEENYVAQKFARVVLGTNNVDCCARVCHAPSAQALGEMLGTGAATSSFDDVDAARTIFVLGANVTEGHPVFGARIKQRALRGANLIVVDPRRIELSRVPGALHLPVHPGENLVLLHAMAHVILEEGLADEAYCRDRVDGLREFGAFVRAFSPEVVAPRCGVPPALIRRAARLYATEGPTIAYDGLGATEHVQGTEGVMALVNLALLTGNIGRPGAGVNPLRGQNNVQGSAHMGCDPSGLTGLVKVSDAAPRFEAAWGVALPREQGLRFPSMLDRAAEGRLHALWVMGYDILATSPTMQATRRALDRVGFIVVQDLFLNETAREVAHLVLPSACSFEKDGTFMNAERRVQRVRKAVEPPGEARTDWEPLCQVARAMGKGNGFAFRSAEEIWEEVRAVWPRGRGIRYDRLEAGGLQWPCPDEDHPGTVRLHEGAFVRGPRAALRVIAPLDAVEATDGDYPFLLNTGRSLYQFNAGTMTMRGATRSLRSTDRLDMAREDAARLSLAEGTRVRVRSRYGAATLPVHIDDGLREGELFATFSDPRVQLNEVTGPFRDTHTETPAYKRTAVAVDPVAGSADAPTPSRAEAGGPLERASGRAGDLTWPGGTPGDRSLGRSSG